MSGVAFVSDVHLRFGDDAYLAQFVKFLEHVPREARTLYIHGDLFDFYVGAKQGRLPFYAPLFDALRTLTSSGVKAGILAGNRDFLLDGAFARAGVEILPDEIAIALGDRVAHLSHGDQFCIHDTSYLAARTVLRSRVVRALMRAMPASFALFLANRYRAISRKKTARMLSGRDNRLGTILDGVTRMLNRRHYDFVICGHIHHLAQTPVRGDCGGATLVTTGAWEQGPNFLLWDGEALHTRRFEPLPPGAAGRGAASC